MINYHFNDLFDECQKRFYETFQLTLDVADYVPEKYIAKVQKYIYKKMKRMSRRIEKEDKRYQRTVHAVRNVENNG